MSWESVLKKPETNASAKIINVLEEEVKHFLKRNSQVFMALSKLLQGTTIDYMGQEMTREEQQTQLDNLANRAMETTKLMQREINNGDALLGLGAILDITLALYFLDSDGVKVIIEIRHNGKNLVTFEMSAYGTVSKTDFEIRSDDHVYSANKDGSFTWGDRVDEEGRFVK
jgi:hypothetical protein